MRGSAKATLASVSSSAPFAAKNYGMHYSLNAACAVLKATRIMCLILSKLRHT